MQTHGADPPEDRLTIEEFERLPDDAWRTELVRGLLVREPPAGFEHGRRAARIATALDRYAREHDLGVVVAAETGFVLAEDPPTVRAPDAAFVSKARLPADPVPPGFARLAPDLAVEIASPSHAMAELYGKAIDYLEAGTREVWVVDPQTRTVTVFRPDGGLRLLREADALEGGDILPGFRLPVAEIFG